MILRDKVESQAKTIITNLMFTRKLLLHQWISYVKMDTPGVEMGLKYQYNMIISWSVWMWSENLEDKVFETLQLSKNELQTMIKCRSNETDLSTLNATNTPSSASKDLLAATNMAKWLSPLTEMVTVGYER